MAYNPQNPNGQATSANSAPVVVASDQSAVNVNLATSSLATQTVNVAQISGSSISATGGALNVNISSGSVSVGSHAVTSISGASLSTSGTNLNVNLSSSSLGTQNVNLTASTSGGWTPYFANAITSTVTVSSTAGKFGGYMLINLNSVPAYLQVFDTTSAVTLGSTTPNFVLGLPANGTAANGLAANLEITVGVNISNGIKVAATTTASGSSLVSTGLTGSLWYK